MKTTFFTLLFIIIYSFSPIYAEIGGYNNGTEVVSISLEGSNVESGENVEVYNSPNVDGYKRQTRKEKRIQVGKDILNAGVSFLDFSSQEAAIVTMLFATPVIVIGSAVLIWGALTKEPASNE